LIDCEHRTPPARESGYPYVAIPQIKQGRLDLTDVRRISETDFHDWTRKTRPQAHDVILSRRCNPGETAVVPDGLKCALGQNLVLLRSDGSKVFAPFLRWLVRGPDWWEQIRKFLNVGAVFDSLKCADVPNFSLPIPPLPEQHAIAHILGTLDDKIELNRRMNETLEAMARALFKSWFVDFDPVRAKMEGRKPAGMDKATAALFPDSFQDSPLGAIPKGWRVGSIYEIADVVYGASFSSRRFNTSGNGLPLIRIRDLSDHSPGVWTDEQHPKGARISAGDIVVGMDGEFRAHVWQGPDSWLNQRMCQFKPKATDDTAFVLYSIQGPLAEVERSEVGTTVIHLGKSDIDQFQTVLPPPSVRIRYAHAAAPLLRFRVKAGVQSRSLAALRDALLPKLLSGELRVSGAGGWTREISA